MRADAGFREIDHTADWALELWAPDLEGLLEQAAAGMYEMSGLRFGSEIEVTREFELDGTDREQILVQFLSDLLYTLQTEHLAFDRFEFDLSQAGGRPSSVTAAGDPVAAIEKEIKAVTWHDLAIEETGDELRARVTFDV